MMALHSSIGSSWLDSLLWMMIATWRYLIRLLTDQMIEMRTGNICLYSSVLHQLTMLISLKIVTLATMLVATTSAG